MKFKTLFLLSLLASCSKWPDWPGGKPKRIGQLLLQTGFNGTTVFDVQCSRRSDTVWMDCSEPGKYLQGWFVLKTIRDSTYPFDSTTGRIYETTTPAVGYSVGYYWISKMSFVVDSAGSYHGNLWANPLWSGEWPIAGSFNLYIPAQ